MNRIFGAYRRAFGRTYYEQAEAVNIDPIPKTGKYFMK